MHYSKHNVIILFTISVLLGCGGSRGKRSQSALQPPPSKFESVTVPEKIALDQRNLLEKTLYLLPANHPKRVALRDRIIEALEKHFMSKPEDDVDGRLALFEEALSLHDPGDFKPERVASSAGTMAAWVVEVFEQRGNEAVVLAGLRFLMFAKPDSVQLRERYLRLSEWSESVRGTITGKLERLSSLIDLYRSMVQLVPDREVVEHLAELYIERYRLVMTIFQKGGTSGMRNLHPLEAVMQGRTIQTLPYDIIYIFFLTGEPAGARKYLADLVADGRLAVEYLELLDRIFQGIDEADSYFALAKHLAPIDARVGLKACILARAADPKDPRYPLYIGRLFDELDQPECAVDFYLEAAEIIPTEEVLAEVIELLRRSLLKLHLKEHVKACERVIDMGNMLVDRALKKEPEKESLLRAFTASLLFTMGEVEFDDGRIDLSRSHLLRSYSVLANVPALVKLTDVHYLLGDFGPGIEILKQANGVTLEGHKPSDFWKAVILERQADLTAALGRKDEARKIYNHALAAWELANVSPEQAPLAAVHRGIVLNHLGDMSKSQQSFRLAVRLDPNRRATYAELISFLVIQGRLEDAKEFYRLAYNQDRIEAMWKIYYSLWVEGLSLRLDKGSFDMARGYLEHSRGETWQDKLALFFTDKMSSEALQAEAVSTGQRVEIEYYRAIKELAHGKEKQARSSLQKVIDSRLLGFFEYRMATALMRQGLKPVVPSN